MRPLDVWPGTLRADEDRTPSMFTASWEDTQSLLKREVVHLVGDEDATAVLQLAVRDRDLRQDGDDFKAGARGPDHPGVVLNVDTHRGPLRFSTDMHTDRGYRGYLPGWQSNVRAIALGLEALRKVDRYGLGAGGEQYVGWTAIGSGIPLGAVTEMTRDEAARILLDAAHFPITERTLMAVMSDPDERASAYRVAAKQMHPDKPGGSEDAMKLVTQARRILDT